MAFMTGSISDSKSSATAGNWRTVQLIGIEAPFSRGSFTVIAEVPKKVAFTDIADDRLATEVAKEMGYKIP